MRAEHTRTAYPTGVLFGLSVALSLYVASAAGSLGWGGAGLLGVAMGATHAMASVARQGAHRFMGAIISGLWLIALALGLTAHPTQPAQALLELLTIASGLSWLWSWSSSTWPPRATQRTRTLRHGAAVGVLLSWGAMVALPLGAKGPLYILCAAIWALVGLHELVHAIRAKDRSWMRGLTPLLVVCQWVALVIGHASPKLALTLGLVLIAPPWLKLWLQGPQDRLKGPGFWEELILTHPARAMFSSFGVLGLLGGLLLTVPAAAGASGRQISLLDGVFTSFSAACVTGLAVLDTPHDFSFWGQLIILVLIQLGGLSIMAFSTMGVFLLGKRMSLRQEAAMSELLGSDNTLNLRDSLKAMMLVTIWTEGLGAALLTLSFWVLGDKPLEALWRGVFTSISAFCNAGFALQSDSLMSYQQRPIVLMLIALIITVGGLGPAAALAIGQRITQPKAKVKTNLQVKLILWTSMALTVSGFVLFLLMEWDNTLAPLGLVDKLSNALFQSVTLRTAGFNSLDLAKLDPATLTLTLPYMFIGGSPGSTAGGAKTTTFALLVLLVISAIRGHDHTRAFGFQLPGRTVYRAAAVGTLSAFNVLLCLLLLQLTQPIALESMLFETVSALGTVGLSIGATGQLDGVGKVIIVASMFIGRLGPLTLFLVLTRRQGNQSQLVLPQQDVAVG